MDSDTFVVLCRYIGSEALRLFASRALEKEGSILDALLANANKGGIVTIPALKPAYETICGTS